MNTIFASAPRARITAAIESGRAPHLRPIMEAVRDHRVVLGVIPQGPARFEDPPVGMPAIMLVGDDLHTAMGPNGFHQRSLKRFIRRCRSGVIVSCAPIVAAYAAAATRAAVFGQDVILIETRLEQESAWKTFVENTNSDIKLLIATVIPEGSTH